MPGFSLILFDADETLFDFEKGMEMAFRETLIQLDLPNDPEKLLHTYRRVNAEVWAELETGKIEKEKLKLERFRRLFQEHSIERSVEIASDSFLSALGEQSHLFPGALDLCASLAQHTRLVIVTNGIESVQKRRLELSPLKEHIEFMVVSEECGFAKPDRRIFEHTLLRANQKISETALMVGDRLETDIAGAKNCGFKTCWYNPRSEVNSTDTRPDFEVRDFSEILKICTI